MGRVSVQDFFSAKLEITRLGRQVAQLEDALRHQRELTAVEAKRADRAEASARHAFSVAAMPTRAIRRQR